MSLCFVFFCFFFPLLQTQETAQAYDYEHDQELEENDQLTRAWFRAMCIEDITWCQ